MIGEYFDFTLNNGLRIVHQPSGGHVAHCGFFINVGTRDERMDEFGMAHFVEHMLFKGTKKRKSFHVLNRMEAVGGELNAFTNKEETVIYSTFLVNHFERALELLSDLVMNSQFPQNEIDKEIEVVIDEIHSYIDLPSEQIYDDFEDILFQNKSMGHNILGNEDSLRTFDREKVCRFVKEHYTLSNMVFFSYGNVSFEKIRKLALKYFSDYQAISLRSSIREPIDEVNIADIRLEKDTSQAHVVIGGKSYEIGDKKRKTLSLINNILGGPGMNSRLNISLREKRGYVYNVESNINSYSDIGVFYIYFGCDKKNVDKCIHYTLKELDTFRNKKMSTLQLHAAKKQYIGQFGISMDNSESLSLALGKNYFHFKHFNSMQEIEEKINSVTTDMVQDVCNEIFYEKNLSSLIYI